MPNAKFFIYIYDMTIPWIYSTTVNKYFNLKFKCFFNLSPHYFIYIGYSSVQFQSHSHIN